MEPAQPHFAIIRSRTGLIQPEESIIFDKQFNLYKNK